MPTGKLVNFCILFLGFLINNVEWLHAQTPLRYWNFNNEDFLIDRQDDQYIINTKNVNSIIREKSLSGYGIAPVSTNLTLYTHFFRNIKTVRDFTIEFAFKADQFMFLVLPKQDFRLDFSVDHLYVSFITLKGSKVSKERWDVPLKGSGITSYNRLADNQWHHFVLVAQSSGSMTIWIDGKTDPALKKKMEAFDSWVVNGQDGFRVNGAIDEIALYDMALPENMIRQHWSDFLNDREYSFTKISSRTDSGKSDNFSVVLEMDQREYALGYPDYTMQATDQLKRFPLPRYAADRKMLPNFPWMDITYLHRELPGNGGVGFGKTDPEKAVEMTDELVRNWNYYIEIPTLRVDAQTAEKRYRSPTEIFSSLVKYANEHPELPAATVLMQVQSRPVHAGLGGDAAYVKRQDLQDRYYLRDESGRALVFEKKKWLNPFTAIELIEKDALTSVFYINQLAKYLTRPINMINENGEWFGHQWKQALLEKSPEVVTFLRETGKDYYRFNGWMQHRFDSVFKTTILKNIPWQDVKFTFYNVSAYHSAYWPDYTERINTNSHFNGFPRSTPSFYPVRPDNWRLGAGPNNGYGRIAEGRKKELELGVKYFAPFVNAGWSLEEKNIRPAQWLGLLKSMVMLGADFFHVGYFNVTGSTGWANGKGPNDPRGYIYQAAMPAYAQAIASHVWDFLDKGLLLEDSLSKIPVMPYAFKASAPCHLVLVRKLGNKYLIFGSIQPNANYRGNTLVEATTAIQLEEKEIRFIIRRQGSMYELDLSDSSAPFIRQLDGWHQYEHPSYWTNDVEIEAENIPGQTEVLTERQTTALYDFSDFNTFRLLQDRQSFVLQVPDKRTDPYKLVVQAKRKEGDPILIIRSKQGVIRKNFPRKEDELCQMVLSEKEINSLQLVKEETLTLEVEGGVLLLDKLFF